MLVCVTVSTDCSDSVLANVTFTADELGQVSVRDHITIVVHLVKKTRPKISVSY